jgi:hypothetical protein
MNKYEIKYLLETELSKTDRLIDVLGKHSHQFDALWQEIREKQDLINNQTTEIRRLKDVVDRYRRRLYADHVQQAKSEKTLAEFMGESVDN